MFQQVYLQCERCRGRWPLHRLYLDNIHGHLKLEGYCGFCHVNIFCVRSYDALRKYETLNDIILMARPDGHVN